MRRSALLMAIVLAIGIVPVAGATSSLSIGTLSYDSTVIKDSSFTVTATVTASGVSGSTTVTATLQDNTGGAVTIQSAEQVKTYTSNTSKTFTWTVTANTPGTYSGPLKVTASASDGGSATPVTGTTVLTIQDKPVLELTLAKNQTTVNTGDSVRLDYTIENMGGSDAADAEGVNISLSLPGGWSLTSGTSYYTPGTIAHGASKSGNWIVAADSPNSTNTLTATVTSTVPGGTITDTWVINKTTTGDLDHINVTPTLWNMNVGESKVFTAAGKTVSEVTVSGLTFTWYSSDTYVGTINSSTGNFTALRMGTATVYATSNNISSRNTCPVTVNVNAATNNTAVSNGSAIGTSGNSTAIVSLTNTSVTGTINITELADPQNSTDAGGSVANLGSNDVLIMGVEMNVSSNITSALENDTNQTSWVQIRIDYNESRLGGVSEDTLYIYKFVSGTGWVKLTKGSPSYCLANGRNTTANYVWANVTHLCTFGLVSDQPEGSDSRNHGSGGGGGTYPPDMYATPTPTVTTTATPTTSPGTTAAATGTVAPVQTGEQSAAGAKSSAAEEKSAAKPKKKGLPGFVGVSAIAGLLAALYLVRRRM